MPSPSRPPVLLVRAGARLCALPIEQVIETMRALPLVPLSGTPPFVAGAAVVRGAAVPVVHLDALLGAAAPRPAARFVLLRCGARTAALAVDGVIGVASLDVDGATAPLLEAGAGGAVETLGARDGELLVVLRGARVVPEEAWRALERRGEAG